MAGDPAVIDPGSLDRELVLQPQLTRAAGQREADARHALDQAKARLKIVTATVARDVRTRPEHYGLSPKPTKDAVDDTVVLDSRVQEAERAVIDAQYAHEVAKADSLWTLDRRKAVERLVDLLTLDYYAEREPRPRTSGGRATAERAQTRAVRTTIDDEDMFPRNQE